MDNPESKEINLSGDGLTFATKMKITGFALIYLFGIYFIAHIIMRCLSRRRQRNKGAGGLNPRILKTLPVVVIGEDDKEVFKNGSECVVCLSEFCDGERARILPKCQHGYHADCIDMWFQSHSDCPLCRSPVDANGNETSLTASSSSMAVVAAEESLMVESCGGPEEVSVIDIPKQMMDEEKEKEQEQDQAAAAAEEEEESPRAIRSSDGVWVMDMPRQMVDQEKV